MLNDFCDLFTWDNARNVSSNILQLIFFQYMNNLPAARFSIDQKELDYSLIMWILIINFLIAR